MADHNQPLLINATTIANEKQIIQIRKLIDKLRTEDQNSELAKKLEEGIVISEKVLGLIDEYKNDSTPDTRRVEISEKIKNLSNEVTVLLTDTYKLLIGNSSFSKKAKGEALKLLITPVLGFYINT